jgi:hypothetical protein
LFVMLGGRYDCRVVVSLHSELFAAGEPVIQ